MKKLSSLFSSFLPSNLSAFQQKLAGTSLLSSNSQISMSDILFLIECFEGFGPECNGVYLSGGEYVSEFFELTNKQQQPGIVVIKLQLTLHLILYEFQVGELLAEQMLQNLLPQTDEKDFHYQFTKIYSVYLMRIAQGLKIFYAAKVGQYPPLDQKERQIYYVKNPDTEQFIENQAENFKQMRKENRFSSNNLYFQQYQQQKLEKQYAQPQGFITTEQKTIILFKLHNLITSAIQILKAGIQILVQMKSKPTKETDSLSHLYIEISCVIWNDIMVMYKFSGQEINKLLDSFRSLHLDILMSLQQLYHSIIDITNSIKSIYTQKKVFDIQNIVRRPFWFEENKKLTLDINSAIIDERVKGKFHNDFQTSQAQTPARASLRIQPFSARNQATDKQFFISNKNNANQIPQQPKTPSNDTKKPHQRQQSGQVNQNEQRQPSLFQKFTGGIFDEGCEYMSPKALNRDTMIESIQSNRNKQESTAISREKQTSHRKRF